MDFTVQRVQIASPGGYDHLCVQTTSECLEPAEDEVLIQIESVGVNYADVCVRLGLYASAKKYVGWPITPGFEFAGKVLRVGSRVEGLCSGESVFGVTRFGAYSSHIVVPSHQVFQLPPFLSMDEAAGMPSVFLTAYYCMFELAHPHPDDYLLVHSAAGGVGSSLVQLGKICGCKVVAVVGSKHKVETCQKLGADHVIDKSSEDLWAVARALSPKGYYAIFDANGVETIQQSFDHLALGGKLVVYGFHTMLPKSTCASTGYLSWMDWLRAGWRYLQTPKFSPLDLTGANKSVMACNLSYMFDDKVDFMKTAVHRLLEWFKEGKLKPPPVTAFRLVDVADAHRSLESGLTVGKLVLKP
mmetsp:Transcript_46587/g.117298  ORF Transcript_46587/g.117298 Transcript_46587/m.117298 type:complete len:357 (+) Transcript_46587:52-1122(+)